MSVAATTNEVKSQENVRVWMDGWYVEIAKVDDRR